jgi:Na+/melibiose symporter-like transporter
LDRRKISPVLLIKDIVKSQEMGVIMQRHREKTKHPFWMWPAARLAGLVALTLFMPLILGIFLDKFTGLSPLGLLLGMTVGIILALIIVLRTIRKRLLVLSPIVDEEDNKESL